MTEHRTAEIMTSEGEVFRVGLSDKDELTIELASNIKRIAIYPVAAQRLSLRVERFT